MLNNTPSLIPKPIYQTPLPTFPSSPSKNPSRQSISPAKTASFAAPFLSKHSNTPAAWDTESRFQSMEKHFGSLKEQIESTAFDRSNLQEHLAIYRSRGMQSHLTQASSSLAWLFFVSFRSRSVLKLTITRTPIVEELETLKMELSRRVTDIGNENVKMRSDLDSVKRSLNSRAVAMEDLNKTHALEIDELRRRHREELDYTKAQAQIQLAQRCEEDAQRRDEELQRQEEMMQQLQTQLTLQVQSAHTDAQKARAELAQCRAEYDQETTRLHEQLLEAVSLKEALKASVNFLESGNHQQSQAFADLNAKKQEAMKAAEEANAKLRGLETLRRKLHNQVQELKGNIRVFCRVRPALDHEIEDKAKMAFPDSGEDSMELTVMGHEHKSATGKDLTSKHGYSFDRVFGPSSQNSHIFDEISQLVQSALDGYNVCIFCYGQTGSGKTYTMSAEDGMIPLAVHQIYETAHNLEEKGWKYTMEGSFVEVYNENLNDLLGKADDLDKKKLEIRHDNQKGCTTIKDVTIVALDSPATVKGLLERATSNRSVASTNANERSSRSHSVFMLKLIGENSITSERSEGILNLVDLAGSERLAHSGATGDRLRETQNINRSLSCLGDVISALGQGKHGAHIPYRNSKVRR